MCKTFIFKNVNACDQHLKRTRMNESSLHNYPDCNTLNIHIILPRKSTSYTPIIPSLLNPLNVLHSTTHLSSLYPYSTLSFKHPPLYPPYPPVLSLSQSLFPVHKTQQRTSRAKSGYATSLFMAERKQRHGLSAFIRAKGSPFELHLPSFADRLFHKGSRWWLKVDGGQSQTMAFW